jgi:hypothetical protein
MKVGQLDGSSSRTRSVEALSMDFALSVDEEGTLYLWNLCEWQLVERIDSLSSFEKHWWLLKESITASQRVAQLWHPMPEAVLIGSGPNRFLFSYRGDIRLYRLERALAFSCEAETDFFA